MRDLRGRAVLELDAQLVPAGADRPRLSTNRIALLVEHQRLRLHSVAAQPGLVEHGPEAYPLPRLLYGRQYLADDAEEALHEHRVRLLAGEASVLQPLHAGGLGEAGVG